MVSERDRALVEARARGLSEQEVISATAHPWRQIFKWDLVGSAVGISVFLLLYYAASAFFTIYWATVFKNPSGVNLSTAQANSLNAWFWWADIVALIVFGILSDLLKVRKPLMLVGAVGSIVMLVLFIHAADNPHTGLDTLIGLEVALAACISLAYAPWMAGYTEMVEAKNPALVGTGLALWGWLLRLTVGLSFIFLPLVVTSVNPVVDNLQYAQVAPNGHAPFNVQQFQVEHPQSVAFAEANASWLTVLQKPAIAPVVAALNSQPDAGQPGRVPEGGGSLSRCLRQDDRQRRHAEEAGGPLRVPARLPRRPPEPAHQPAERRGQVAQAVAGLVLGVPGGHGRLHPDHLAEPWPVEPVQGPRGRAQARGRRPGRAQAAGRRRRLTVGVGTGVPPPSGAIGHPPSTVSPMEPGTVPAAGFAVIDLETTGFSPLRERVVEVAVVLLDADGTELDAFCTLVDPECDPGPTHVHGITGPMLEGAPTFAEVHPYLAGLLSGRVVVGHNVDRFDLAFLRAECGRLGEDRVPSAVVTLDTLQVAQTYLDLPGKARLIDCCDHYRLTWADHHNALGDARVTADLLGAMRVRTGRRPARDRAAPGRRAVGAVAGGRNGPPGTLGPHPHPAGLTHPHLSAGPPCRPDQGDLSPDVGPPVREGLRSGVRPGHVPGRPPASRPCPRPGPRRPPGVSG